jgi:hypothetical protein
VAVRWRLLLGPGMALSISAVAVVGAARAQPVPPPVADRSDGDGDEDDGDEEDEDRDEFLFRPFFGLSSLSLALESGEGAGDSVTLDYQPNVALSVGARAGYGAYMASGSIATAPSNEPEIYGRSRYLDLQLAHSLRADEHEVVVGIFLQQYRGFYLEGAQRFDPSEMNVVTFPKMKATNIGVTMTFFLDPGFSYEDAFMEYRPERRSEGSWALRLSLGHMSVDTGGAALVPETQRARFGQATGLQSVEANFASATVGYAYDWMIGRGWFLGAQLLFGLNAATATMTMGEDRRRQPSFNIAGVFHLAAGYTGERFHGGLYAGSDLESLRVASSSLQLLRNFAIFFFGVRF